MTPQTLAVIRVRDLRPRPKRGKAPFLFCSTCGQSASADREDYPWGDPDYIFECCGTPMRRVVSQTVYSDYAEDE